MSIKIDWKLDEIKFNTIVNWDLFFKIKISYDNVESNLKGTYPLKKAVLEQE